MRAGNLSKAGRGYALKARALKLKSGRSAEQGFRAIVTNCLAQVQDNETGVIRGTEPESLHQMRVGMRRLRSAQRLFATSMRLPDSLRDELDWLAAELGPARDWDVLADGTLGRLMRACPGNNGLLPLHQAARAMAAGKRQQAALAVESVRYSRLMLALAAWLQDSGWRGSLDDKARQTLARPLDDLVAQVLVRRHRKLLWYGKRLHDGTAQQRHRVRIAAKKARYAAEFFRPLLAHGRVDRYIKRLHALQDALGAINDAAVADTLLSQMGQLHPELSDSAAYARGFLKAGAEQDLCELNELWRRLRGSKLPARR